ncbi:MAG TPA: PorP/SprF family type IX secretion system membrane protein [Kaistella chaponensis]|jgi:type IX secretion system PorP/SprF family membrane protein|uniref:PorP/SprF family type IX secretion system membrane protein n=1 Tax=Kaistella chaponensis TaxID=713588 RepID=UPI002CD72F8C|nr:PorP/SprF family type IX secretion system membrane protein [Kaistella chaponensis]HPW87755.1 PorP/SprF family type IX secretion system membrane protein [Kaistella chaponensis]HQC06695.1 PorP/SprF family type IX secretion system membrane protein [Kaistella chaponensis]
MRKIYVLFFVVVFLGSYKSQETLPYYQQYLIEGDFLFNPALYGKTDNVVLNMNYQKQFSQFDQSPNVQSIGLHANVFDRVGAGLSFFRDQNGPISSNGISAGASYFIPIDDDGERKSQFSFGTNVNFYNMNIDLALLNPKDQGDPTLASDTNSLFLVYANLGLAITYRNFFAGVSVNDIALTNDIPIVNGIEPEPTKFIINTGYDLHLNEDLFVTPSVLMNFNTNSSRIMDLNLMATVLSDQNSFSAGASMRTSSNQFGSQNLGISPIIKATVSNFFFGASYNFGLSDIQQYAGSSFMLSVGYKFENFINTRGYRY